MIESAENIETKAIRAACLDWDLHLTCSYPECTCAKLPKAIRAALNAVAAIELLEAAQLLENAELARQDCDECEGEGEPEACGRCFPSFDDSRIKRRNAIAKAIGTFDE